MIGDEERDRADAEIWRGQEAEITDLRAKVAALEAEQARLRGLISRLWIQCEKAGKPSMCWDMFHELQKEAAQGEGK
jgi:N-methylhydantoinase B/oxoprolinase/acetone carboxylase alpha subunit